LNEKGVVPSGLNFISSPDGLLWVPPIKGWKIRNPLPSAYAMGKKLTAGARVKRVGVVFTLIFSLFYSVTLPCEGQGKGPTKTREAIRELEGTIRISGAWALYPMAVRWSEEFRTRRIADYVIFLYMGELVEQGPAQEVFNNPRDERTRAYISGEIS